MTAWAASRGLSTLIASCDPARAQWDQERSKYPPAERWDRLDWRAGGNTMTPAAVSTVLGTRWDWIVIDPVIGMLGLFDESENDNGALRRTLAAHVEPVLNPGGTCVLIAHTGNEHKGRGRGASDLQAWSRLAAVYKRQDGSPSGYLERVKVNGEWDDYPTLRVGLGPDRRVTVTPSVGGQPRADSKRDRFRQVIEEHPDGISRDAAADLVDVTSRTARRYLDGMDGVRIERDQPNQPSMLYPDSP